jgi:hypothetical protein
MCNVSLRELSEYVITIILYLEYLEFFMKLGKHSIRTLSLVQNWVRFPKKKPANKYISIQGKENSEKHQFFVSSPALSFFLSASIAAATYIFAAPTCTTTIISLDPCALNAEFQHFTPKI